MINEPNGAAPHSSFASEMVEQRLGPTSGSKPANEIQKACLAWKCSAVIEWTALFREL